MSIFLLAFQLIYLCKCFSWGSVVKKKKKNLPANAGATGDAS